MRITNNTGWSTADLRRVFSLVLARWNAREEKRYQVPSKRLTNITVVNSPRGYHSGHAYHNSGTMRLRYPKPHPDRAPDVRRMAWIFEHELAHCAGYAHKATNRHGRKAMMGYINHGPKTPEAWAAHYGFVDHLTIGRQPEPAPKPKPDRQALAYERTLAGIARWTTKAKRAQTALRTLAKRRRYYERALAAKRPSEPPEGTP